MSPDLMFWLGLAFKIALTAGIVVTASVLVERSGPFLGAIIASLPTAAAAAYILLGIEHPPQFVAASAVGSMAANAAVAVFACVYAWTARSHGYFVTLAVALAAWLACAALFGTLAFGLIGALLLNIVVYAVTFTVTMLLRDAAVARRTVKPTPADLVARALTVGGFVAVVTTASHQIGSFASGMFAVFPVAMASFMAILHPRLGGVAAGRVLAYAQAPLFGLVLGFAVVHLLAEQIGTWWSYLAGFLVCVVWNLMLWTLQRARSRGAVR